MLDNPLDCDERLQWIHIGQEQDWLTWSGSINVAECVITPSSGINKSFLYIISYTFYNSSTQFLTSQRYID